MIDEIYDNVLSLSNQIGYIDFINNTNQQNPLKWLYNNNFNFNSILHKRDYPIAVLSFDEFFRAPFSNYINKDGIIEHIY